MPKGLGDCPPVYIAPPAIDPLTIKNSPFERDAAFKIVSAMGIDQNRPLITQVSRFDVWKDPWGVVDAFRMARKSIPGLQLAMLGLSQATDDPEALDVLESVRERAESDPDIHLYFDPEGLPATIDEVVNAFQVASDVLIQKSLREGFGLTITEAMWKGKPVIGGNVGGIRVQIENGVNGYLVDTPEECASRIVDLLNDPALRSSLGNAAREEVRGRFLMPALALDYLNMVKTHALRPQVSVNGYWSKNRSKRYAEA